MDQPGADMQEVSTESRVPTLFLPSQILLRSSGCMNRDPSKGGMHWIQGSQELCSILVARAEGVQHHCPVKNQESGKHCRMSRGSTGERCASNTEQNLHLVPTKLASAFRSALVTCRAGLVNGCHPPELDPRANHTCSQVWEVSHGKSHHLTVLLIRFLSVGTGEMPQYFSFSVPCGTGQENLKI